MANFDPHAELLSPTTDPLSTTTFDDPVPVGSESSVVSTKAPAQHDVAADVQRVLQRLPGVIVDTLAVRQLNDGGLLLEGTLQATSRSPVNFAAPVQDVTGVPVIDRMRVRRTSSLDETHFEADSSNASKPK